MQWQEGDAAAPRGKDGAAVPQAAAAQAPSLQECPRLERFKTEPLTPPRSLRANFAQGKHPVMLTPDTQSFWEDPDPQ